MNIDLYRIFNAVGDSVILCTLIKEYGIKTITYNRADLDAMKSVMKYYDCDVEFKRRTDQGLITPHMHDYVRALYDNKIQLAIPKVWRSPEYTTRQTGSFQNNAADRAMTMYEHNRYVRHFDATSVDVVNAKTIPDMFECLSKSMHHISIDSGTAWAAASMGIPTTVYSKNSYYFSDAYFYMQYLDSQPSVDVYQQDNKGVKVANELQFKTAISVNKARLEVSGYETYRNRINERSKIQW